MSLIPSDIFEVSIFSCCFFFVSGSLCRLQVHVLHQSLRDLRCDHDRLSQDFNREILWRNRYLRGGWCEGSERQRRKLESKGRFFPPRKLESDIFRLLKMSPLWWSWAERPPVKLNTWSCVIISARYSLTLWSMLSLSEVMKTLLCKYFHSKVYLFDFKGLILTPSERWRASQDMWPRRRDRPRWVMAPCSFINSESAFPRSLHFIIKVYASWVWRRRITDNVKSKLL